MSKQMSERAVQARREYNRRWREKNKEHIRAYNAKYWEQRANIETTKKQEPPRG